MNIFFDVLAEMDLPHRLMWKELLIDILRMSPEHWPVHSNAIGEAMLAFGYWFRMTPYCSYWTNFSEEDELLDDDIYPDRYGLNKRPWWDAYQARLKEELGEV